MTTLKSWARINEVPIDRTICPRRRIPRIKIFHRWWRSYSTSFSPSIFCYCQSTTKLSSAEKLWGQMGWFAKAACPTASVAQHIELTDSRYLKDISESLASYLGERTDFTRQFSFIRFTLTASVKSQTWAEKEACENFSAKFKYSTQLEFRFIRKDWLWPNPKDTVTVSDTACTSNATKDSNLKCSGWN